MSTGIRAIFICVILTLLAALSSCERFPAPEKGWMPVIVSISAQPDITTVVLEADLKQLPSDGHICGFYYGKEDAAVDGESPLSIRVEGTVSGKKFYAHLQGLSPETRYEFKAFVGNGRSERCSQTKSFMTLSNPETPDEPKDEEPDDEEPDDEDPKDEEPKDEQPNLYMEVFTTDIDVLGLPADFNISLSSNVGYEVIIPDHVDWLSCVEANRVLCRLRFLYNSTGNDRSCEVIIKSLEHDSSAVINVCQRAVPIFQLELAHTEITYYWHSLSQYGISAQSLVKTDEAGETFTAGWLSVVLWNDKLISMTTYTNYSSDMRTANIMLKGNRDNVPYAVVVKVIQHAGEDCVSLECDAVRKVCTGLWDTDADGRISYQEAAAVSAAPESAFSGAEYTSFDKFRWFTGLQDISPYMFAYSGLETITLPEKIASVGRWAFKGCARLRSITFTTSSTRVPVVDPTAFDGLPEDFVIYVPNSYLRYYLEAWPDWRDHITGH